MLPVAITIPVHIVGFARAEPDLSPDEEPLIVKHPFSTAKLEAWIRSNPGVPIAAQHSSHRANSNYLPTLLEIAKKHGLARPILVNDEGEPIDIRLPHAPDPAPFNPDTDIAISRSEARIPAIYAAAKAKAAEEGKTLRVENDAPAAAGVRAVVVRENDPEEYVRQQRVLAQRTGRPLVESVY